MKTERDRGLEVGATSMALRMASLAMGLLLTLGLSGCEFSTDLQALTFACESDEDCVSGEVCDQVEGVCVLQGTQKNEALCENMCTEFGEDARRCSVDGVGVEVCRREPTQGCLIWITLQTCEDGLPCTDDLCDAGTLTCKTTVTTGCVIDGACVADGASQDGNACRICDPLQSTSSYATVPSGATCTDGNPCTVGDTCQDGFCIAGADTDCADGLACTDDVCDTQTGACTSTLVPGYCLFDEACVAAGTVDDENSCLACQPEQSTAVPTPVATGVTCDDGDDCTVGDRCVSGACEPLSQVDCDDGLFCTTDVCSPTGCASQVDAGYCLINGACVAGGAPSADNPCMICQPEATKIGYTPAADGAPCQDDDPCTVGDSCGAGVCLSGGPRDCDDARACTADSCTPSSGECVSTLIEGCLIDGSCVPEGALDAVGGCKRCDPAQATDAYVPLESGVSCSDGDPCSENDTCTEGACIAGPQRDCADAFACTLDSCDSASGECVNALDGSSCLIDGACVAPGVISPVNPCLACQPDKDAQGYAIVEDGTGCEDADVCTLNTACQSGVCTGGDDKVCDDGLPCTADTCVSENDTGCIAAPATGCVIDGGCVAQGSLDVEGGCQVCDVDRDGYGYSAVDDMMACSDGLLCTLDDVCMSGVCESGTPRDCDDGLGCTTDSCDEAGGVCVNVLSEGCLIEGECVAEADERVDNPCEYCAPSFNTEGWTPDWGTVCHPYPGGEAVCEAGVCQFSCPAPLADCDAQPDNGCEVDLSSDLLHCGACANLCTGGTACLDGTCTADCGELTKCGPYCADLESSLEHCGGCDQLCAFSQGVAVCAAGSCSMQGCQEGYVDVNDSDEDGCECELSGAEICDGIDNDCNGFIDDVVDALLVGDPMNCGVCGEVCPSSDGTKLGVCDGGLCAEAFCPPSTWNLDGTPENGCEYGCNYVSGTETCDGVDENCDGEVDEGYDLLTDVQHCGACDQACAATALADGVPDAVATWSCVTGACFIQKCEVGWVDKDQDAANGCEHAFSPDGIFHVHWLDGNDFTANGSEDYPFQTIQGALDAIMAPDWTVLVAEGLYDGGVVIPAGLDGLSLIGSGTDITVIESLTLETGITIEADNVQVSDLKIVGGDIGVKAYGTADAPLVGTVLERLVLDELSNPNVNCPNCYHGDGGEDGGCNAEPQPKQCELSSTIGVDLAHTEGSRVSLVTFLSIAGGRAPGSSFWYNIEGRPAIGLQVANSTGCNISANQVSGPLIGGLGSRGDDVRSAQSGASIGMRLLGVTDSVVTGNLVMDLVGTTGKSAGSTSWGHSSGGQGADVIAFQVEGASDGLVLTGNAVQNVEAGAGGAGYNGNAGGLAIGVYMTGASSGATLTSNTFAEMKGGLHSGDGARNVAYGVWLDDDSVAHQIDSSNQHEGEPIYYLYGADGAVLEDLNLTGTSNPTNLGKLAIVASTNVTVSGGDFAGQRGAHGLCSGTGHQTGWSATPGARAVGILLRDCEGCSVLGATVHDIEGGRGGGGNFFEYYGWGTARSQGHGTAGYAAGIALEGSSTVSSTLSGNTLSDLRGGQQPPCLQAHCPAVTTSHQGALGVYVAEEARQNVIDETNMLSGEPILYRYGVNGEGLAGYTITRKDLGTNWGQVAIFESSDITLLNLHISGTRGIQGTEVGWSTAGVNIRGCEQCTLDGIVVHDMEAGRGSASGRCNESSAGGAMAAIALSEVSNFTARHLLLYDLRGGPSGGSDCGAYGTGGAVYGLWTEATDGRAHHMTITGLQGGVGASHAGTESIHQEAQGEGQVFIVQNSILSGASTACITNLETNPTGTLQVYTTSLHACGPDAETWASNAALVSGNLYVDPLFESLSTEDLHLSSASPAIDAGIGEETGCEGYINEPAPNGCAPNLGFYGNTAEAKTKDGAEHCPCEPESDGP